MLDKVYKFVLGMQEGRLKNRFDFHRTVHRNAISVVKPTGCTNTSNVFYFWNDTLHVLGSCDRASWNIG